LPSNSGSRAKFTAIRRASSLSSTPAVFRHQGVSPKIEPSDRLTAGVLDPKGFGVLDDLPGRREATAGHFLFRSGKYGFHFVGVTICSVPLFELTQPAAVCLHAYGSR
jgi:hypothetical protein